MPRLLVVSHPCVVEANQGVYDLLLDRGWSVDLLVPARWKDDYRPKGFAPSFTPRLRSSAHTVPVALPGREQRHIHLARVSRLINRHVPDIAFLEQEPFAMVTAQWTGPLSRRGIPFGVQQDENLDRPLPRLARGVRARTLDRAQFVWARSPRAADLARRFSPGMHAPVVPHAVPGWRAGGERLPRPPGALFTVGYAGRLVPEKGIDDLLAATSRCGGVRLLAVGAGPLEERLRDASSRERPVAVRAGVRHEGMEAIYSEMDVLVLPSRTTARWAEQFGRVLVEAMWCGVPVIGSDSGEIPWVVQSTGGGLVFPERDVEALAAAIERMRDDDALRKRLSQAGHEAVKRTFSVEAVAAQMDAELRSAIGA